MKSLSKHTQHFFKEAGREGGRQRARGLSATRRRDIAIAAARARWKKSTVGHPVSLPSVRLKEARWTDPMYLEEVLSSGTLADWRLLYRYLYDHPFGPEALALERVCRFTSIYGTTPLWTGILRSLQGFGDEKSIARK